MRRTVILTTVALLAFGGLSGCDDDPSTTGDDADVESDTTPPDDTGPRDTLMDTTEDTGPMDADDTSEETGPDDTGPMDADDTTPDASQDTIADSSAPTDADDGDAADGRDMGDTRDTAINRDVLPSQFGSGSYIDSLYIDDKNASKPWCCFDFDGDGTNDNALAEFLDAVRRLSATNTELNQQISNGSLTFLFEYLMWSTMNWKNDSTITMYTHSGEETPQGNYLISPKSYKPNGQPRSKFKTASTSSAKLNANKGKLFMPFSLSLLGGVNFTIRVLQPKLEADVGTTATVGPGGKVPLKNGKLGGVTPKKDLYTGINDATSSCSCLQGNKLLTDSNNDDIYTCYSPSMQCTSLQCRRIVGLCSSFIQTEMQKAADVDRDGNGNNDALTFGASFTAQGAKITGVAP